MSDKCDKCGADAIGHEVDGDVCQGRQNAMRFGRGKAIARIQARRDEVLNADDPFENRKKFKLDGMDLALTELRAMQMERQA